MKICIIHTGGTIAMVRNPGTNTFEPGAYGKHIFELVPELSKIADVDPIFLFHEDSANFTPKHWVAIGKAIFDKYYDYDGFVITHGTDQMAYTASAVSLMIAGLGKPIIFTGSQVPLSEIGTDGRNNLVNATRIATMDIGEVGILFGSKLMRGSRAKKLSEFDLESFGSPNFPYLAEIGLEIEFTDWEEKRHSGSPYFYSHFEEDCGIIKVYPGMKPDALKMALAPLKGAIIEGFGAGNIPVGDNNLIPVIEHAIDENKTIVISTQCVSGSADYERYVGGMRAKARGALSSYDMTVECALVKLMWVLGRTREKEEVRNLYMQDLTGEMRSIMNFEESKV